MSEPNPPRRRRVVRRRWYDERIWREFYASCLIALSQKSPWSELAYDAAKLADHAYAEYRERFPIREPELDDEAAALELETDSATPTGQTKKDVQ